MSNFKITFLKDISFEQFKSFLDSLDEEKKSWSLDLQNSKDEKEFYDSRIKFPWQGIVCCSGDDVIGLSTCYNTFEDEDYIEVSFVVKKEFQGNGVGTILLSEMERLAIKTRKKAIIAKHYRDNIASHKAFLKAGYSEPILTEKSNLVWKIKELTKNE